MGIILVKKASSIPVQTAHLLAYLPVGLHNFLFVQLQLCQFLRLCLQPLVSVDNAYKREHVYTMYISPFSIHCPPSGLVSSSTSPGWAESILLMSVAVEHTLVATPPSNSHGALTVWPPRIFVSAKRAASYNTLLGIRRSICA